MAPNIWLGFARGGALAWVTGGPICAGVLAAHGDWWGIRPAR